MDNDEIKHTLGVVVGKLDMLLENQKQNTTRLGVIEGRVASLESHRGYMMGAFATIAIAWTLIFEWIKHKITP
jgi:hypothetical protein